MRRISFLDGDGDIQATRTVAGDIFLDLIEMVLEWDMYLCDLNGTHISATELAAAATQAGTAPVTAQLYSNDDDDYPMGVCVVTTVWQKVG